ncbi:MAG: hypothetical protein CHACPFDD_03751 [Phycisphaerae bacterium]|nr:hypothetical protein [Phycisphaerae bacterium]
MNLSPVTPTREAVTLRDRLESLLEALALLTLGVVFMNFLFAASPVAPGGEVGAPGHDSYYHVRMAAMLIDEGLPAKFPWLQFTYWRAHGDEFVSHHVGFHVLLAPFILAARALGYDDVAGGRWAISFLFGANLLLFNVLLRMGRVPHRWLWIALWFLLPDQFFSRHAFIRAIGASYLFMQLTLIALFSGRYALAGLALAGYVHLYLGAVMYGPLLVALYTLAQIVAPADDRRWPVKMILWTFGGWLLGVVTYPYSAGIFEFLKMQVFASGLAPDIEVGREWKPYSDPWAVVGMTGNVLIVWVAALLLRFRWGPRLNARETTLLLAQFAFLLLTLKARRFIEYWPSLALLNAAWMAGPPLNALWRADPDASDASPRRAPTALSLAALAIGAGAALWAAAHAPQARAILAEWRAWTGLVALLLLVPLARIWIAGRDVTRAPPAGMYAIPVCGAALFLCVALAVSFAGTLPPARLIIPRAGWVALAALYLAIPALFVVVTRTQRSVSLGPALLRSAQVLLLALTASAAVAAHGARAIAAAIETTRCQYKLPEIRAMMAFLKQHSQPGDVVFTDDWDIFPVYFYHNSHNHYIVGLDPKFTHERRPDLWERYVRISRGQVPSVINVAGGGEFGVRGKSQLLNVALRDIRDEFRARYVITDSDHTKLAAALADAPDFAELVYPPGAYTENRLAPYLVFRVRDVGELTATAAARDADGRIYLSTLTPRSATQGWGQLGIDRSVDGNLMRIRGRLFRHGLGTHAPSRVEFDIPAGAATFEATVGVDDETAKDGSATAAILLDDARVCETPLLTGGGEPATIRIPLGAARRIVLLAETATDGQRNDHVDWADARFMPAGGDSATQPAPRAQVASQPTAE